jgi:hypothetical protein
MNSKSWLIRQLREDADQGYSEAKKNLKKPAKKSR